MVSCCIKFVLALSYILVVKSPKVTHKCGSLCQPISRVEERCREEKISALLHHQMLTTADYRQRFGEHTHANTKQYTKHPYTSKNNLHRESSILANIYISLGGIAVYQGI